jgi:hypothetical protein
VSPSCRDRNAERNGRRLGTEVGGACHLGDAAAERRSREGGRLNLRRDDVPVGADFEAHRDFRVARDVARVLRKTAGDLRLLSRNPRRQPCWAPPAPWPDARPRGPFRPREAERFARSGRRERPTPPPESRRVKEHPGAAPSARSRRQPLQRRSHRPGLPPRSPCASRATGEDG